MAKQRAADSDRLEEGQPELLDDPDFDRRLDARLVEIGRKFGLNRHVGRLPGSTAASSPIPSRRKK